MNQKNTKKLFNSNLIKEPVNKEYEAMERFNTSKNIQIKQNSENHNISNNNRNNKDKIDLKSKINEDNSYDFDNFIMNKKDDEERNYINSNNNNLRFNNEN